MTFQVSYKKSINYWKRAVKMTRDDRIEFCCESALNKKRKKVHIVCRTPDIGFDSPSYEATIARHRSGSRFTLLGRSVDGSDDRLPQLAGIAFYNLPGSDSRIRCFRVALPNPGTVYIPANRDGDISKIALTGCDVEGVTVYSTVIPEKMPGGRLYLDFGPYQKKRSLKNFIIRDKDGGNVFAIFKATDNMLKIKTKEPFSPIVAFAVSVAIITSMK